MQTAPALQVSNLYLSFSGNIVLHGVDFTLEKGEAHAILGQNATGKSTLVKAIMGIYTPSSGTIHIANTVRRSSRILNAEKCGVHTVYQDFKLFPNLSVKENIFINKQPLFFDDKYLTKNYEKLKRTFSIHLNGDSLVSNVGAGEKKLTELMRAYVNKPDVLILDEPAAFFTDVETKILTDIISRLKQQGTSIIYITHKMKDALAIADRVSVMYDGKIANTFTPSSVEDTDILKMMAGKNLKDRYPKVVIPKGKPLLYVKHLCTDVLDDINFTLFQGEILGITGVVGCGKTSLGKSIFGLNKVREGRIVSAVHDTQIRSPRDAIRYGVGYVAEESRRNLIPDFDGSMNISLSNLGKVSKNSFIDFKTETAVGETYFRKLLIDMKYMRKKSKFYSGGEQQKLCLARLFYKDVDILIIDEPTKGVDIPSKVDVYNMLNDFVSKGKGVILLTSDFSEACGMCDRVIILNKGSIVAELSRKEVTEESIISYSTHKTF